MISEIYLIAGELVLKDSKLNLDYEPCDLQSIWFEYYPEENMGLRVRMLTPKSFHILPDENSNYDLIVGEVDQTNDELLICANFNFYSGQADKKLVESFGLDGWTELELPQIHSVFLENSLSIQKLVKGNAFAHYLFALNIKELTDSFPVFQLSCKQQYLTKNQQEGLFCKIASSLFFEDVKTPKDIGDHAYAQVLLERKCINKDFLDDLSLSKLQ